MARYDVGYVRPSLSLQDASALAVSLQNELGRVIVGQQQVINEILTAFLAGGHVLLRGVPTRWRETLASLPFYVGLLVVYNLVINGPSGREMNQTLFIFTWPLMLAFVNTCMKSPLLPALLFNGFALSVIALAVHEAPVSPIVGGLMMTNAIVMAFFSLLASYWLNVEGRRSYLYKLREEVRLASLNSANQDLQILSETDSLTGLANRRQLHLLLEAFWQRRLAGEQGAGAADTAREAERSGLEDTDITKAIVDLQKASTILQATQSSLTRLSQLSLFDYLR